MAADREQYDELSDVQMEHLLKLAYDAPEPDTAYVDALSAKLDREFSQSTSSDDCNHLNIDLGPLVNGAVATNANAEGTTVVDLKEPKQAIRRSWLRLGITLATAASLLVAISLWSSPPAYGWVSMLRALEQCSWVKAVSTNSEMSGWASASQEIVAAQVKNRVVLRNDRQATGADYRADEKAIYQKSLESRQATNWEARLLVLLLADANKIEAILSSVPTGWELVSESWNEVDGVAGHDRLIELRVKLKALGAEGKTVELEFLLDPQTQLPISGRVLGEENSDTAFEFAYPEQGPTTIFALGVPKETEFVAASETILAETDDSVEELASTEAKTTETDVTKADLPETPHNFFDWEVPAKPLAEGELVEQLNASLGAYWESQRVQPAELATDEEFLRRVYLDLAGRIPMVSEVYQFLEDTSPDRRARLVDDLLSSHDCATHLAAVWRTMLLPSGADLQALGGTAKFDEWLAGQFGKNLPYDQQVAQLLSAEGRVSESGPLLFYAALKLNPEELAAKTSRVFLGSRMECAQCHDHPFDTAIRQKDFWGFAAYFAQISRPKGKMEVASRVLRVKDNPQGEVVLPDTDEVIAPRLPSAEQGDVISDDANASRRQQLVSWLTSRDNQRFAAAAVNHAWAHLFGRGLIDPVDDMRLDNAPAVPDILELLSKDFAASGYDFRRLMRTLVLSEAYQLSSRAARYEESQTLLFARMNMKSMTADQLYDCIAVATQNESMLDGSMEDGTLARINNTSRQAFIAQFQAPPGQRTDYHAGIPQALTLLHGQIIDGATDLASSGLLKSLAAPFFSDQQRIDTLFLATLSRLPDEDEREPMLEHVRAAKNDAEKMQAMGDVLWALLNSAEFTFIH